ncbi:unnamed protein product [Lupinus luteus]|uniref:Uncharacterized protein n=1 Tax=Lupinus luteus TaxID=3873 RepID=A0AAV1WYT5_LUPLU
MEMLIKRGPKKKSSFLTGPVNLTSLHSILHTKSSELVSGYFADLRIIREGWTCGSNAKHVRDCDKLNLKLSALVPLLQAWVEKGSPKLSLHLDHNMSDNVQEVNISHHNWKFRDSRSFAQAFKGDDYGRPIGESNREANKRPLGPSAVTKDWKGMEYTVDDKDFEWLSKCLVGRTTDHEKASLIPSLLKSEGIVTISVHPMGGSLVLLVPLEGEVIQEVVQAAEDFGSLISADETTTQRSRFDKCRLLIKTSIQSQIHLSLAVRINGKFFDINIWEEWGGDSITKIDKEESRCSNFSSDYGSMELRVLSVGTVDWVSDSLDLGRSSEIFDLVCLEEKGEGETVA